MHALQPDDCERVDMTFFLSLIVKIAWLYHRLSELPSSILWEKAADEITSSTSLFMLSFKSSFCPKLTHACSLLARGYVLLKYLM